MIFRQSNPSGVISKMRSPLWIYLGGIALFTVVVLLRPTRFDHPAARVEITDSFPVTSIPETLVFQTADFDSLGMFSGPIDWTPSHLYCRAPGSYILIANATWQEGTGKKILSLWINGKQIAEQVTNDSASTSVTLKMEERLLISDIIAVAAKSDVNTTLLPGASLMMLRVGD